MSPCQTYIQHLREEGMRITPQREMIIEALAHGDDHMSAEAIYQKIHLRAPAVNLATVYRTLDLLVEKGLAWRSYVQDGRVTYASNNFGSHLHLVCRNCGASFKVDRQVFEQLNQRIEQDYHFQADLEHTTIRGLCQDCRNRRHASPGG